MEVTQQVLHASLHRVRRSRSPVPYWRHIQRGKCSDPLSWDQELPSEANGEDQGGVIDDRRDQGCFPGSLTRVEQQCAKFKLEYEGLSYKYPPAIDDRYAKEYHFDRGSARREYVEDESRGVQTMQD
jgi:hypothetical protein